MAVEAGIIATDKTKLKSVPIGAVNMRDGFWKTKMDKNHEFGLPALRKLLEEHGYVESFGIASGRISDENKNWFATDSDVYKWMEGAALDLQTYDDPDSKAELDRIIDEVVAAQGEDGYLNTFYQGDRFDKRFTDLPNTHELYCAGHLFQAAVAYYRATGDDKLLSAACRYADYLVSVFGHDKRQGVDGHPEVEMALVELYRTTGKKDYLDLAEYFLSQLKFKEMKWLGGHAVRALYTCCAGADSFAETGDAAYKASIDSLWNDLIAKKMYITGGVGSRYAGEAIGSPYELPNHLAYAETCAAIASVMFNYRMLSLNGDARCADEMERALYNGVISGVSLDGVHYFYVNPLSCYWEYQREEWFGCTCCPTNMVRMLASVPGYIYSISDEGAWIHLFDNSDLNYHLADGSPIRIRQNTNYPWDGAVEIGIGLDSPKEFTLFVRVPGWCSDAALTVNGEKVDVDVVCGAYVALKRVWESGDCVCLKLDMPITLQEADPRVSEDFGLLAVQRGPLVYCAESTDNPGTSIMDLQLASPELSSSFDPDLLGGVVKLQGVGASVDPSAERGPLYRPVGTVMPPAMHESPVTLIPYYAWANRGISSMTVWMPVNQ